MRFFFFILLTVSACAQSVGDFSIPYKANSTGPQTLKSWAKANSTLWGTDGSGNPQSITIGSGLSLTSGVLTSSGGGGVGTGTVTSVALTMPNIFSVTGSPITASGTLAASLATQSANTVFAGPTTGSAAAPTFRALVAADIPDLSGTYQPLITDGSLTIARTNGLQTALNAKLSIATAEADYLTIAAAALAYQPTSANLNDLSTYGSSAGGHFAGDVAKVARYGNLGELGASGSVLIYGDVALNVTTLTAQAGVNPTVTLPSTTGTLALTSGNITGTAAGLSSTLAVSSGGTGQTTWTNGQIPIGNTTGNTLSKATLTAGTGITITNGSGSITISSSTAAAEAIVVACSDETTALTTGTAKVTFRMPFAMTVTSVRLQVNTAPTGSVIIVDVKEAGTTIFSTKPQIATSAFTSVGGPVPGVVSDTSLADDAEITINIDQIGSTIAGKGLKVTLIGTRQ